MSLIPASRQAEKRGLQSKAGPGQKVQITVWNHKLKQKGPEEHGSSGRAFKNKALSLNPNTAK
jgi:hypothetical protein